MSINFFCSSEKAKNFRSMAKMLSLRSSDTPWFTTSRKPTSWQIRHSSSAKVSRSARVPDRGPRSTTGI